MNSKYIGYIRRDTGYVLNHEYDRETLLYGFMVFESPIFDALAADRFASDRTNLQPGRLPMTDRNEVANHEKLIEDARRAYLDAWAATNLEDVPPGTRSRNGIIAALAVFEKALGEATVSPTDDEREALAITDADLDRIEGIADPIYRSTAEASRVSKYLVSDLGRWIVRLVAEVRRLRTAEAEDERIEAWHYVADHEAFKACYVEEQPLIDSVLARITQLHELETTVNELAPVPEPVTQLVVWIDRTLGLPMYQTPALTDYDDAVVTTLTTVRKMLNGTTRPDASWRTAVPQGEPSDAQVRAAREAWLSARIFGKDHLEAMRVALRAANEVR